MKKNILILVFAIWGINSTGFSQVGENSGYHSYTINNKQHHEESCKDKQHRHKHGKLENQMSKTL